MPSFSEQVRALCDEVFATKCARVAAVADFKAQTGQLLEADRAALQAVREEQAEAAARLKADLAANCRERSEGVQEFRNRVRTEHRAASDRLRQALQQNVHDRQETVSSLLEGFDQAQRAFAQECQTAARLWQEMTKRPVGSC